MRGLAMCVDSTKDEKVPLTLALSPRGKLQKLAEFLRGERGHENRMSLLPLARGRRWPKAG